MSAPKFVIQYRDQFGNYRNYQTQHGRTSAYRTAETRARQTGKVYRIIDEDGDLVDLFFGSATVCFLKQLDLILLSST